MNEPRSCACEKCKRCCEWFPGYFLPDEVPLAAKTLGVSLAWFKRRYTERRERGVLSPRVEGPGQSGIVGFLLRGTGRCVFLTKERSCRIYEARPYECRMSYGGQPIRTSRSLRAKVMRAWRKLELQREGSR